jgi:hypothetical protein
MHLFCLHASIDDRFTLVTSEVLSRTESGIEAIPKDSSLAGRNCVAFVTDGEFGDYVGGGNPILVSSRLADLCRNLRLPASTEFAPVELLDDETNARRGEAVCVRFRTWIQIFDDASFAAYLSRSFTDSYNRLNMPSANASLVPDFDLFPIAGRVVCTELFFTEVGRLGLSNLEFERIPVRR